MNRATNLTNPNPFHSQGQDIVARDLAAIQCLNAFHTNVNLNNPSPMVFLHSYALSDCSDIVQRCVIMSFIANLLIIEKMPNFTPC